VGSPIKVEALEWGCALKGTTLVGFTKAKYQQMGLFLLLLQAFALLGFKVVHPCALLVLVKV